MPSWIRSSRVSSEPWYFFAIETTSRRFALIMRSLAPQVAALDALGEVDLLGRRQQPVAADLVEEELQRVGRDGGELRRRRSAPRARPRGVQSSRSSMCAGMQLLVEGAEFLVLELQGLSELVDLVQVDAAALLASVDEGREAARCTRHAPVPWLPS